MDIMVTVPKESVADFRAAIDFSEYTNEMFYWWVSKYPTQLEPGDNITFAFDGHTQLTARVKYWQRKKVKDKKTGKETSKIVFACIRPRYLEGSEKVGVESFQGFRYIKPSKVKEKVVMHDDDLPF